MRHTEPSPSGADAAQGDTVNKLLTASRPRAQGAGECEQGAGPVCGPEGVVSGAETGRKQRATELGKTVPGTAELCWAVPNNQLLGRKRVCVCSIGRCRRPNTPRS